jgi:hypothetical protein
MYRDDGPAGGRGPRVTGQRLGSRARHPVSGDRSDPRRHRRQHATSGIRTKETDGWKVAQPSDHLPRGRWWEIFGDPQLHALVEEVGAANQNLKIAEARFREARAMVRFNRAALFPTISAGLGVSSIRDSANRPFLSPNVSTGSSGDFLLSLDLSYEVDLWGRVWRTVKAARQEAQATAADLETARLSLQAEVAIELFRAESRRRPETAPGRDSKGLHGGVAAHDRSLPGRGGREIRRCPGPDSARDGASAGNRHHRAACPVRARDCYPDR